MLLGHRNGPSQIKAINNNKITLTIFSDSQRHFEANDAAETLKNVVFPVVAIAFASIVLPVPGGPNNNTPFHGLLIP